MAELRELVEAKCAGHSLNNYQFQFNGKPLQESNHGRKVTLQDHNNYRKRRYSVSDETGF